MRKTAPKRNSALKQAAAFAAKLSVRGEYADHIREPCNRILRHANEIDVPNGERLAREPKVRSQIRGPLRAK
jgi:hypothetical protein